MNIVSNIDKSKFRSKNRSINNGVMFPPHLLTCFLPENNVVSNGLFWGTQQDRTELMMMRCQNGYIGVTTSSEIYVVGKVHASPDIDGNASSNSISGSNL